MPDFGGASPVIFDAYWEGKFAPQFTVRAGKFKPPVGLERLQSATDIAFAERGFPDQPRPEPGHRPPAGRDISEGLFAYQIGVFNGVPDLANGGDDLSDAKDFAARVFLQPFKTGSLKGLGVGVAGSTGKERGTTAAPGLAAYRTPGQNTFFRYTSTTAAPANTVFANGDRTRISRKATSTPARSACSANTCTPPRTRSPAGPLSTVDLEHTAWQAEGSYFLTGQKAGLPEPRAEEAVRSQGRHLGRVRARRPLWRAGHGGPRSRRTPIRPRARRGGGGVGRRPSTGTSAAP